MKETMNKTKKICQKLASIALLFVFSFGILVLGNAGCKTVTQVSVDYGTSRLYSSAEMDKAVAAVKADFANLAGCKLISLKFAGDDRCKQELEYANKDRAKDAHYTACIVFDSVFRSPVAGGGAWEPNKLYRWSWTLAKTGNGAWIVINKGYA